MVDFVDFSIWSLSAHVLVAIIGGKKVRETGYYLQIANGVSVDLFTYVNTYNTHLNQTFITIVTNIVYLQSFQYS